LSFVLRPSSLVVAIVLIFEVSNLPADDYTTNAARLQQMTPEQKDDLRRKKIRFDELGDEEKKRLRDLHDEIASDPNAKDLQNTATAYNRWLRTLDSAERSQLLDIKDPEARIERIKELMHQQETRRFQQYSINLPEQDREAIFKWLEDFVAAHEAAIVDRLPGYAKQRIADAADADAKRRELFRSWQRHRREFNPPSWPSSEDHAQLVKRLSAETQKILESSAASELTKEPEDQRTPERQQALQQRKVEELVRTAYFSRMFPQISQEELLKYYAAMKSDDPRRKQLEGKEGEELRRELQRIYNGEHFLGRGGPPGGPPAPGPGRFGQPGPWPGPPPRGDGPPR